MWWRLIKKLYDSITLSEEIRGDLLLESSELSATEQLMVLTTTNHKHVFDLIADALTASAARPMLLLSFFIGTGAYLVFFLCWFLPQHCHLVCRGVTQQGRNRLGSSYTPRVCQLNAPWNH